MKIHPLSVPVTLPQRIGALRQIACNLWWSWNSDATELFRRVDQGLWEAVAGNPIQLLRKVPRGRLEELAVDQHFLQRMDDVRARLEQHLTAPPRLSTNVSAENREVIAYFSPEFGLTQSVPLYAGGLGILAGDHLKAASDLGLPLVGVGLLYREGYFVQLLNADGWQQESYPRNDFSSMPITQVTDSDAKELRVSVDYPGRTVTARIWKAQVGKVPLYLLDTDLEENREEDRDITAQLYGGGQAMRLKQEIMLGIGGMRLLTMLTMEPLVCHMNEGHSALQAIERIRLLMERHQASFHDAREAVAAGSVFTTHTPVPAGNDVFQPDLVAEYLGPMREAVRLTRKQFLALGRQQPHDESEPFSMPVLALRLASCRNGVSRLHGRVARQMWQGLWPTLPEAEIPITHVTNGVHLPSWVSRELTSLYDRHLGAGWRSRQSDPSVWKGVDRIPDRELWSTHEKLRSRLVEYARARVRAALMQRGAPLPEIESTHDLLDPRALTICFARRAATYKRGWLIFTDPDRLARILNQPGRPVQLIFAGKAHPADHDGKEIIQSIVRRASEEPFRRHVAFLEDYDIDMARWLLHGTDVWLNNPRRPLEACGTSGMKAAMNGAVNVSIPDGWWAEAYRPEIGWNIGEGKSHADLDYQDRLEARELYEILEEKIVPCFYSRDGDGLPRAWLKLMKASIRLVSPQFNTDRMLQQYNNAFYQPAARRWKELTGEGLKRSKALARWRRKIEENWNEVRVITVERPPSARVKAGEKLTVRARIHLGPIQPGDVAVELYAGELDGTSNMRDPFTEAMNLEGENGDGTCNFACTISWQRSGRFACTVRVRPSHPDLPEPHDTALLSWE